MNADEIFENRRAVAQKICKSIREMWKKIRLQRRINRWNKLADLYCSEIELESKDGTIYLSEFVLTGA